MIDKPLTAHILQAKKDLQADDKELARHLKLNMSYYREIASGARVLPMPSRKTLERLIQRLYELCGMEVNG